MHYKADKSFISLRNKQLFRQDVQAERKVKYVPIDVR